MKTRLCFYCEKEILHKDVVSYGGPFAFRHFCTCRECFEKYRYDRFDCEPPVNLFGTWLELERRVLNLCEHHAIEIDVRPETPLSIRELLEWVGQVIWDDFQSHDELYDPPKVDGLGRRAVPLFEILKAREAKQISIEFPSTARCVLGKFDHRDGIFEDISDELP